MSELSNIIANLTWHDPTLWIAVGSGLAVILAFLFLGRRSRRLRVPVASNLNGVPPLTDDWIPPSTAASERRRSIRRAGVPTPVQIVDPKKRTRLMEAFVLDRSTGGLRLAMEKPFPTGTILHVRPGNSPEETLWIAMIVRSCKESGDYYEVGCQFEQELPWNQLLLFG